MNVQRKRVLVADCHGEFLVALEKILEEAGFDTATVWTAREALQLLDAKFFDLVLINEYLPDGECEGFLKALQERGAQTPCVVMQPSAPEITDFRHLRAFGARDVVCKYAYCQVVDVIRACLACEKQVRGVA
jgi:DNA-binding NtrC family response regulator